MKNKKVWGTVIALFSGACYGTLAVFTKVVYAGDVSISTILFLRFTGAALLFWLYFLLKKGKVLYDRKIVLKLLLLGALGYGCMSGLFFLAVDRIPASLTTILLYLYPALVSLTTVAIKLETFTLRKGVALLVTSLGLIAVLGASSAKIDLTGIFMAVGSACVYSVYIIFGSNMLKNLDPLRATMYILSGAAVVYAVIALLSGSLSFSFARSVWPAIGGIIIFATVLAMAGFWYAVKLIGPSNASIISTVEPLVTVITAWLAFGEVLGIVQLAGGALILVGVLVLHM